MKRRGEKVMVSVGVIGSGAWGTTLACLLAKKGIETTLWEHRPERAIEMQQQRENTLFLPGIRFPAMLYVTSQVAEAARGKDMLLLVTPSQRMRENVRLLAPSSTPQTFVSTRQTIWWASNWVERSRMSLPSERALTMAWAMVIVRKLPLSLEEWRRCPDWVSPQVPILSPLWVLPVLVISSPPVPVL